jgi:hypothetical protein
LTTILGLLVSLEASPTWAQTGLAQAGSADALRQEIASLRAEFDARLAALESRLAALGGGAAPAPAATPPQVTADVPPGAAGAGGPSGQLPVYGSATAASKIFNPDIALVGNLLAASGSNDLAAAPAFQMAESELSLQAIVDPYARADVFLAFGEEGVDLEEGYITFLSLPGGLLAKAGKMRAAFGKVNTLHTHIIPWVDRPLVTDNLVAGEEGISDAGLSVSRLLPNPWLFLEATGQLFRGDAGDVFTTTKRSDLAYATRLRGYADLSESTNVDLGVSFLRGPNGAGLAAGDEASGYRTTLYGLDATVRWRPLRRSIYRSFVARSELVWSRRDQPGGLQRAVGWFASGDYQFSRRWFTGVRLDRSDRATDASRRDAGGSWTLTFWPSEFSQIRGQLRRTAFAGGARATEALFQIMFNIGAHGAHPF